MVKIESTFTCMFFSWTFDLLLINFSKNLLFGVYFSPHQRNILCDYKLQMKPIMKQHFSQIYWCKKTQFSNVKLKSLWTIFNCFNFMVQFLWRSHSQMFFKIGALKNVKIFWIKRRLQHRCFHVNIAKFLRTTFL